MRKTYGNGRRNTFISKSEDLETDGEILGRRETGRRGSFRFWVPFRKREGLKSLEGGMKKFRLLIGDLDLLGNGRKVLLFVPNGAPFIVAAVLFEGGSILFTVPIVLLHATTRNFRAGP